MEEGRRRLQDKPGTPVGRAASIQNKRWTEPCKASGKGIRRCFAARSDGSDGCSAGSVYTRLRQQTETFRRGIRPLPCWPCCVHPGRARRVNSLCRKQRGSSSIRQSSSLASEPILYRRINPITGLELSEASGTVAGFVSQSVAPRTRILQRPRNISQGSPFPAHTT